MSYLLNEKLTSTVVMYMVLKRIIKPWTEWEAYKNGIIDAKGKRLRKPRSSKEREGWDILDRFCWSIKRLCTKYLGDSNFAYLFSAVYLMKEDAAVIFNNNKDKYLCELEDLTPERQLHLYRCICELETAKILREANLDLETNINKTLLFGSEIINKYLSEDEGGAPIIAPAATTSSTTLNDIAQVTPRLKMCSINKRNLRRKRHGRNNKE